MSNGLGPLPAVKRGLEVTVFVKEGCHLCDMVEEEIRSAAGQEVDLTVVDIDSDPALQERYWVRIPVVTVNGEEIFEAKMMDLKGRWRERLSSLIMGG